MSALWQEIKNIDVSPKALRSFGWMVGGVLLALAAVIWWRSDGDLTTAVQVLGGIGAVLVVLGLIVPLVLRPVYRVWMALALVLGFVMTHVLMTIIYYLLITPIGLLLRVFGKDPLHRDLDPEAPSYWLHRDDPGPTPERLEKYY